MKLEVITGEDKNGRRKSSVYLVEMEPGYSANKTKFGIHSKHVRRIILRRSTRRTHVHATATLIRALLVLVDRLNETPLALQAIDLEGEGALKTYVERELDEMRALVGWGP